MVPSSVVGLHGVYFPRPTSLVWCVVSCCVVGAAAHPHVATAAAAVVALKAVSSVVRRIRAPAVKGAVIVITGASQGIGRAIAMQAAAAGASQVNCHTNTASLLPCLTPCAFTCVFVVLFGVRCLRDSVLHSHVLFVVPRLRMCAFADAPRRAPPDRSSCWPAPPTSWKPPLPPSTPSTRPSHRGTLWTALITTR